MGKLERVQGVMKHEVVIQVNPTKSTDYTTMQACAVVTQVSSYDILVGRPILYPLKVTLEFREKTTHYINKR
jgi:hypothetical protein